MTVLFALGRVLVAVREAREHPPSLVIFIPLCLLTDLPFAFGCWLIAEAENHYGPGDKRSGVALVDGASAAKAFAVQRAATL